MMEYRVEREMRKYIEQRKLELYVKSGKYVVNPNLTKLIQKSKNDDKNKPMQHTQRKKEQVGVCRMEDGAWRDAGEGGE